MKPQISQILYGAMASYVSPTPLIPLSSNLRESA